MCVIIAKNPGVDVPFDKIKNACRTNTDGFGMMVLKDGKFEVRRTFEENGNDPEKIARLLEPYKDQKAYLHLRFRTSGAKALESCHPFKIMDKDMDGADLFLMHNGTISEYDKGMNGMPDSYHYGIEVVKPLYDAWENRYDGSPLDDKLFQYYISLTLKTGWSRVLLLDHTGAEFIINKDKGKDFAWGWASNDSYFNEPVVSTYNRRGSFRGEPWDEYSPEEWSAYLGHDADDEDEAGVESSRSPRVGSSNSTTAGNSGKRGSECKVEKKVVQISNPGAASTPGLPAVCTPTSVRGELAKDGIISSDPLNDDPPDWGDLPKVLERKVTKETPRPRFLKAAGFRDTELKELCSLSETDFELIRDQYPDACVMLIMDLLELVYDMPVGRVDVDIH